MPHSSGGGSSSGGSHSGSGYHSSSHSSSGGGGGGGYYGGGGFGGIIAFLVIIFFCFMLGTDNFAAIEGNYYISKVREHPAKPKIFDDANIFTDDQTKLNDAMQKYTDASGIAVYIETVNKSDWESVESLEDYAYNKYVSVFPNDESKWLIVYSKDDTSTQQDQSNSDSMSDYFKSGWKFEGMQGDDTDYVLTQDLADSFNDSVVGSINGGHTPGEAFTYGLNKLATDTTNYITTRNDATKWQRKGIKVLQFIGNHFIVIIIAIIIFVIVEKIVTSIVMGVMHKREYERYQKRKELEREREIEEYK